MAPVIGTPLLALQVERIRRATTLGRIIVATSDDPSDDPIASLCDDQGVTCFRGSLEDVLDRVYGAVAGDPPTHVVRLTGDCPLIDPAVIDAVVNLHIEGDNDYTSNVRPPTWPDGLDVEVIRFDSLEAAWRDAERPSEREHVTPFIAGQPERFKASCLRNSTDLSDLRWTVDEPEDLEFVRSVYERLYPTNANFDTDDVMTLLTANPDIADINAGFARNEGLRKSDDADLAFLARGHASND